MAQAREDGAFAREALLAGAAEQRDVEQLDRGASLKAAVAALGEPDAARAALPDRRDQPVGAEDLAGQRLHRHCPRIEHRDARGSARRCDHLDAPPAWSGGRRQRRVAAAAIAASQEAHCLGRNVERRVQVWTESAPAIRSDGDIAARPRSVARRHREVQVDAALFPVALDGALGHAPHRRDLGERESTEELEVDDLGERPARPRQARRARR